MSIINPFELPSFPLAWKSALPKCPAIYFAMLEKQVLYIGATKNLQSRWSYHSRLKELKAFGDIIIAWHQVDSVAALASLEGQAINEWKPLLNARLRAKGQGSGSIHWKTITRKEKDYPQAWYHYEFWDKGDRRRQKN